MKIIIPKQKYLFKYIEELNNRDSDQSSKWFEYGRSQALMHLDRRKLLLSSLITTQVESYILKNNYIPYSGIYIITKAELNLEYAKDILESQEFFEYIKIIGKNTNSETLKVTAKDINNYYF